MEKIEAFIDSHGLDSQGQIVDITGLSEEEIKAQGLDSLRSRVQKSGNLYYVVLQEGTRPRPSSSDVVMIRYEGMLMDNMQVFDSTMDDPAPFRVNLYYAIDGIKSGVPLFNTGEIDDNFEYINEGQGYIFVPSTMGWTNTKMPPSPVPANSNLIFKVKVYAVVAPEETEQ